MAARRARRVEKRPPAPGRLLAASSCACFVTPASSPQQPVGLTGGGAKLVQDVLRHHRALGDLQLAVHQHRHLQKKGRQAAAVGDVRQPSRPRVNTHTTLVERGVYPPLTCRIPSVRPCTTSCKQQTTTTKLTLALASGSCTTVRYSSTNSGALSCRSTVLYSCWAPEQGRQRTSTWVCDDHGLLQQGL